MCMNCQKKVDCPQKTKNNVDLKSEAFASLT